MMRQYYDSRIGLADFKLADVKSRYQFFFRFSYIVFFVIVLKSSRW